MFSILFGLIKSFLVHQVNCWHQIVLAPSTSSSRCRKYSGAGLYCMDQHRVGQAGQSAKDCQLILEIPY